MTIEDLKTVMDEFDPSVLLPELESLTGSVASLARWALLIGPAVLVVMGLIFLFAAPREANYILGYRCYFGMGSVNAWRYTQRLAGMVWGGLGIVLGVAMLIVSGGFAELETMELLSRAATGLLWQAGLTALSCIGINTAVALRFDRRGELRPEKIKTEGAEKAR